MGALAKMQVPAGTPRAGAGGATPASDQPSSKVTACSNPSYDAVLTAGFPLGSTLAGRGMQQPSLLRVPSPVPAGHKHLLRLPLC